MLQQLVLRSPINIRPAVGVWPHESAIGRGYMAWAYVTLSRRGEPPSTWSLDALECLDWLIKNRATGYAEFCWGDPYEYATRSGRRPRGEPILIWSALIGQAFLDAFEVLRDDRYLQVARSVADWIQKLPIEQTPTGSCLSYVAYRQSSIHNSNAMGAAFLARVASQTGSEQALKLSREAMTYTCARQKADGAWYYAEQPKYQWVDSFHTGYNLSALHVYRTASGDGSFDGHLFRGARYFVDHCFEANGRPKYFHDRTNPVDIQCAAQAIETLTSLADTLPECLPRALQVAEWTVDNMQDRDGHFYYRDLGWIKVKTPMLHWGQATMIKALAVLVHALNATHA
jgi:hypothetical protein